MLCKQTEIYPECECDVHRKHTYKTLSVLLLDCWQREYDKRPYKDFQISESFFEDRMKRVFTKQDWIILIYYLGNRKPKSVKIFNIEIPEFKNSISIVNLVKSLGNAEFVQLKNISLSVSILLELRKNIRALKIKNLDLSHNQLTIEHLKILRCILIHSDSLESLAVGNCFISDQNFAILADGIHKSRSIRSIDISRPCPVSPVSVFDSSKYINLVAQLVWQNKLTNLVLRLCNLSGYDIEPLTEYLQSPDSKLVRLDLEANNLATQGTDLLFTALTTNKNLRRLNLSTNNLQSGGAIVIAKLISSTNLESLDITYNKIECDVMYELLTASKMSCELKMLRIFGNKFNSKSAAVLKRFLRAGVFLQSNIDVTYTWDHSKDELCVIPCLESGRLLI